MPQERPAAKEEKEAAPAATGMNNCPRCSKVMGVPTARTPESGPVADRKHKCQVCRSELTAEYAAKLPAIKAELKRKADKAA